MNSETCPKCGSTQLDRHNVLGSLICTSCGWISPKTLDSISLKQILRELFKWLGIIVFVASFATLSIQLWRWGNWAFEVTAIQARSFFGQASEIDLVNMGAICNSIRDFKCSAEAFRAVVEENPNHRAALANLAIAYSQLEQWQKARPNFEGYFSLDGSGYDAMYWYGLTIENLEGPEKAMAWYYHALGLRPDLSKAMDKLLTVHNAREELTQAASLIGAFTKGRPQQYPEWNRKLAQYQYQLTEAAKPSFELPAIDGQSYFLPVQLRDRGVIQFLLVNTGSGINRIAKSLLFDNQISLPEVAEETIEVNEQKITGRRIIVEEIFIGDTVIKDVEFFACKGCLSVIHASSLKPFALEERERYQIRFLAVTKID